MQVTGWKSAVAVGGGILGIAVFLSATATPPRLQTAQVAAQKVTLEVDPEQSKVHYAVDSTLHTVHGTFALKKGSVVYFDPQTGKAGGEVAVYATSGESGNSSRDERMHKEILETGKYPDAIFRPSQVEGKVGLNGASDVKLRGTILVHGGEHEIVADVHADLAGDHWSGSARFDIPYIQWGIKNPSTWLLKVKPVVNMEVDMMGAVGGTK
ncbi:MAG: YceI family protein [Candidatus Acidiferrum sp.]